MCVIKWVMRSFSGPLERATGRCSWELASEYLYAETDDWVFPSTKTEGKTPLSASAGAKDKIRHAVWSKIPNALKRLGFRSHNFLAQLLSETQEHVQFGFDETPPLGS